MNSKVSYVALPSLIRLFREALGEFAAFLHVLEVTLLAAGRFVALHVLTGLRIFTCVRLCTAPLRDPLPVSVAIIVLLLPD